MNSLTALSRNDKLNYRCSSRLKNKKATSTVTNHLQYLWRKSQQRIPTSVNIVRNLLLKGANFMLLIPNITEKSEISSIIEFLRAEMIQVGIQEGFTSQKTIVLSQTLDEYILTFQTSD